MNTLIGHSNRVNDVEFSPGGDQLASASADRTVRLWSVATGECCLTLTDHDGFVLKVTYSPKGDLLASGSVDNTVRLWDVASGQCLTVVQNSQGAVLGVAWISSTDGNYLVTGCQDGLVVKWQVIEEEGQYLVHPCWIATNGTLNVTGVSIQGVRGLNPSSTWLLRQRGAAGEPGIQSHEANTILASMESQLGQLPEGMELDSALVINLLKEVLQKGGQQNERRVEGRVKGKFNGRRHHPYRRAT
jgi:WD40 repeat protein